jgi:hypothetical protein
VVEEVVALERQERPGELSFGAEQHLLHGDRAVVVGDLGGDAAEALEAGRV